jgi:hypothetical protein
MNINRAPVTNQSKTKWIILAALGATICALTVVCAVGWALLRGREAATDPTALGLPVYSLEQIASEHEGYLRTTLTYENTVYVHDYEESALTNFGAAPTQMIGRLPVSENAFSGVYAIPGQDPSAYALEYDPMYQTVYRNIQHPPFDWRAAEFQKMVLYLPENPKETIDPLIIQDVLTALKEGTLITVPSMGWKLCQLRKSRDVGIQRRTAGIGLLFPCARRAGWNSVPGGERGFQSMGPRWNVIRGMDGDPATMNQSRCAMNGCGEFRKAASSFCFLANRSFGG